MKRLIAVGVALIASSGLGGTALGLSCVHPDDTIRMADLVVVGEARAVKHVSTEKVEPWPWLGEKVTVRNRRAEVRTVRVLKGQGAPASFRYTFRDRMIDCDARHAVKSGERAVFALTRDPKTGVWTAVARPMSAWKPDAPQVM